MNQLRIQQIIRDAFEEDWGNGDLTSESIIPADIKRSGSFKLKQDGVIAGLPVLEEAYRMLDDSVELKSSVEDGDEVEAGQLIAHVEGPARTLLSAERVVLNLLQHMSGIATATRRAVDLLNDDHTRICDTRKTLPGLRMFEKYAVRCGGGFNHRIGLYDGVMIKDNHIAFAGSITTAVQQARSKLGHMVSIEVETESEDQVREAVDAGADVIMFDNRTPDQVRELLQLVPETITTEVSGGITLEQLPDWRGVGVDYISLGMLTHSVTVLDISFNLNDSSKS